MACTIVVPHGWPLSHPSHIREILFHNEDVNNAEDSELDDGEDTPDNDVKDAELGPDDELSLEDIEDLEDEDDGDIYTSA
ncbi:hypothetical protein H4Q26_016337 [Puccinia striiformis f. sp. tritici PST-130]|nr:hypothetical protein H4Q26_016337 [Puccinia striiformis f. sp. tritici PST-130]